MDALLHPGSVDVLGGDEIMQRSLQRFAQNNSGATAIEYALIAATIGIGIVAALYAIQAQLNSFFMTAANDLQSANSA
jgi:pilus assembly protein Flp/PilA